jgi:hypothetical protein
VDTGPGFGDAPATVISRHLSRIAAPLAWGPFIFLLCNLCAAADFFPLEKGTFWVYRGETKFLVKSPVTGKDEPKTEVLTCRMEVVDTGTRDRVFAALIKGAPFDLGWYEPGREPGDYLIVRVGTAAYYLFSGDSARDAWAKIKDEESLDDLDKGGELLIDAPLLAGKVYGGDFNNLLRGRYCWLVEGERDFNSKRFPAAGKMDNPRDFTLAYRTTPDHQVIDFVPGLGIVGFQYMHHGTLAETDLGLIEFGKSAPGR